jgi:ADP-ribosylglycohydrolase
MLQPDPDLKIVEMYDRSAGAIMGAFIGDALGLGCHWYYDLAVMRRDHGPWISDYTTPKPGRYHAGMRSGQLSQSGIILEMLLRSVIEHDGYVEEDFTRRLDEDLFPHIDGTPSNGPGGYTSQSIREAYRRRIEQKKSWRETGGHADTTEAAERALALAVRYARHPAKVASYVASNCQLTQTDEAIVAMTTAFCVVLSQLVTGEKLAPGISNKLMQLSQAGELPFHSVMKSDLSQSRSGSEARLEAGQFSSPDALLTPHYIALAAHDQDIVIEPAWKVSIVYGMPCAIYHQLPAVYYLAARYCDDFESAVLHAINGGGQNMARAMLTGALVGAQVGLSGIPTRFLDGLENNEVLLSLARKLAESAESIETSNELTTEGY